MPERVMRNIAPEKYHPRAKAGIARCDQSLNQNGTHVDGLLQTNALAPLPKTGSQRNCTPKTMIKTKPTKNPGMESPRSAIVLPTLSHHVFTLKADSIPRGTPRTIEITTAANPSLSELGRRSK